MGKARRKKSHGHAARSAADASTALAKEDTQQQQQQQQQQGQPLQMDAGAGGVLDGLSSLNSLTRESSCAAIASLFEKVDGLEAKSEAWAAAQRLIAGGLVKKLLPRMVDRAPGVKMQAIGAMRNISAVRDPRMCEILVMADCLTPVLTLLDRMASTPSAVANGAGVATPATAPTGTAESCTANDQKQQQQTLVMTLEQETVVMAQLVATLCNLLAAVDVAVRRFTSQGGLQVVMRLLVPEGCRGSSDIFGGALQALHVASDSNEDFARQLAAQPGALEFLSALVRGATDTTGASVSTSMRVQAAGVLVNVAGLLGGAIGAGTGGYTELSNLILPVLLEQMAYDPAKLWRTCAALAVDKATAAAGAPEETAAKNSMDVDGDAGAAAAGTPMQMDTATTTTATATATAMADAAAAERLGNGQPKPAQPARAVDREVAGAVGGVGDEEAKEAVGAADQPDLDAQLRWEWKLAVAEPLKLTAEVMANLCAMAVGSDEEEEEKEWGSDDEDVMEQAACAGGGGGGGSSNGSGAQQQQQQQANGGTQATAVLDAMVQGDALQRTLATLQALFSPTPRDRHDPPPEPVPAAAAAAAAAESRLPLPSGVAGDLADLRATVALCAANLMQNLPLKALGDSPYGLWVDLCGMCVAAMERAPSCVETVTGVMWGLVQRAGPAIAAGIRANAAPTVAMIAADPLPLLLRLCDPERTKAFEARVNAVGMLGALGSAATTSAGSGSGSEAAADVAAGADLGLGHALVQAMEDPHVLVQAEALNAVMDIYGEDGREAAFRASGAPAALAAGVPAFNRKVKQEGKALGREAMCHLKETALNASRFVKYKQASGAAGSSGGR